jgi:ABC-type transporter Mla subunit MlaD
MKNVIHENLKRNKSVSLRVLLEEEEDLFSDDAFDDEDENKSDEESSDSEESSSEEAPIEDAGEDDEGSAEEVTATQIEELTAQLDAIKQSIDITKTDDGTSSVESYVSSAVSSLGESIKRLNDLSRFLLKEEEDEDLSDIEADIDDLDRILTKGNELVTKFKKGKKLNVSSYVDAAINAYRNFDSLFSKELIVKQATINVIVLNSGAKAQENVREFEELFHESLHKNFGIEYEEHALITNKSNAASGARSQG